MNTESPRSGGVARIADWQGRVVVWHSVGVLTTHFEFFYGNRTPAPVVA